MDPQTTEFPPIANETFREILTSLKSLDILLCETHEEKKLIYSFKSKRFFCPSCFLKSNLEKSSSDVLDLKLFLSKSYIKSLIGSLNTSLATSNSKINNSVYKKLQNYLSDFKFLLKRSYDELTSILKSNFEHASEEIDRIIMSINMDSVVIRSQEAIKSLKECLSKEGNLINVETFSKITDTKEILDNLNVINYPLFEDVNNLQKFQKEKIDFFEQVLLTIKSGITSLFSLDLDFSKIRTSYTLTLKSLSLREDLKNLKSNMYYGNVLMDSRLQTSSQVYCFPDYINISEFMQFDNLESFKHFQGTQRKTLPCNICGVYNVVFQGQLYARKEPYISSNTIVRINLESMKIENERAIEDFVPQEIINGWSLYNSHFFLANKQDIFLIYGSQNQDTLRTIRVHPLTLEIVKYYDIGLKKLGFDAVFFDGRSLNVVQGNKISFKYDLYREQREELNVAFSPPYSHYNLYYCVQERALWALYPKSMAVYELKY